MLIIKYIASLFTENIIILFARLFNAQFYFQTRTMELEISRRSLFEIILNSAQKKIDDKLIYMEERVFEISNCPEEEKQNMSRCLRHFKSDFKRKWVGANYTQDRFIKLNEQWLDSTITLPKFSFQNPGRPMKDFSELSERSKRRKTEELRNQATSEELTFAACMSQRASGDTNAAELIKKITETPTSATKIKKVIASAEKCTIKKLSPSKALALFVEADLTRSQYETIQSFSKEVYPCYSLVQQAKKECYPDPGSIIVTETKAEVRLQSILDITAVRLSMFLTEVLISLPSSKLDSFELISKWGCDGSKQCQYKQKFESESASDSNIFQSSFVPIRLRRFTAEGNEVVVWQNPVPSSTRFCRPIRITFTHETTDVTNEEIEYIENQIKELHESEVTLDNGSQIKIKHTLVPTMVDGKVCNAATQTTSTVRCYICGETSKNFNDLDRKLTEDKASFKFGLSILHARIRLFESILHLAYKIPLGKWQAKSGEEKAIVAQTKKIIQDRFKKELGLLVDVPKQGHGNTNDGNTSRRFFADPDIAADITGVDVNLIRRLKVILETISSSHSINTDKFEAYAQETAKLYVRLYGWYPMTPTLHKILRHGATVIKHAIVPIGQLSEEAAEARNKHFRVYRQNFSRKFSRVHCNRDVLNRLLLTSDPLISSTRKTHRKKTKPFSSETLQLLLPMEPQCSSGVDQEEPAEDGLTNMSLADEDSNEEDDFYDQD